MKKKEENPYCPKCKTNNTKKVHSFSGHSSFFFCCNCNEDIAFLAKSQTKKNKNLIEILNESIKFPILLNATGSFEKIDKSCIQIQEFIKQSGKMPISFHKVGLNSNYFSGLDRFLANNSQYIYIFEDIEELNKSELRQLKDLLTKYIKKEKMICIADKDLFFDSEAHSNYSELFEIIS